MPRKLSSGFLPVTRAVLILNEGSFLQPVLKIVPSFTLLFDSFFKDLLFGVFFMCISG